MNLKHFARSAWLLLAPLAFCGCPVPNLVTTTPSPTVTPLGIVTSSPSPSPSPTSSSHSITVIWTANREKDVNSSGGGYYVYYSTTSGFSVSGAPYVTIAYTSCTTPSCSTTITGLSHATTYYFKIVAFSTHGNSAPSSQTQATTQ